MVCVVENQDFGFEIASPKRNCIDLQVVEQFFSNMDPGQLFPSVLCAICPSSHIALLNVTPHEMTTSSVDCRFCGVPASARETQIA